MQASGSVDYLAIIRVVMRESAGNFRAVLNGAIVMMEHNRNLSSIVGTIQDEGPPSGEPKDPAFMSPDVNAAGAVKAETFVFPLAERVRSGGRLFSYILFAAMFVTAVSIFLMGDGEEPLVENADPAGAGESVETMVGGEPSSEFYNQEIQERQSVIMSRMEELTATIADLKRSHDQYQLDNQGELNGQSLTAKRIEEMAATIADIKTSNAQYQLDNRNELKSMQQEFRHKIDKMAAALSRLQDGAGGQQESSAKPAKDSSVASVAQPQSDAVPAGGEWVVNVVSSEYVKPVEQLMNELHQHGIPAEIQEVTVGGKVRYRLRIPGFSTSEEARDYANNLDDDLGLKDPWISRR